jgi:hypothetical protein
MGRLQAHAVSEVEKQEVCEKTICWLAHNLQGFHDGITIPCQKVKDERAGLPPESTTRMKAGKDATKSANYPKFEGGGAFRRPACDGKKTPCLLMAMEPSF